MNTKRNNKLRRTSTKRNGKNLETSKHNKNTETNESYTKENK